MNAFTAHVTYTGWPQISKRFPKPLTNYQKKLCLIVLKSANLIRFLRKLDQAL